MKIVFIREHTDDDGKRHGAGAILDVPDEIGQRLVREGAARERKEARGPEETKYEKPDEGEDETT